MTTTAIKKGKKVKKKTALVSLRIPEETKNRITSIAEYSERSTSFIIQKAIENFIELEDLENEKNSLDQIKLKKWQIEGIKKAQKQMKEGKSVDGDEAMKWMMSLGTKNELPMPTSS